MKKRIHIFHSKLALVIHCAVVLLLLLASVFVSSATTGQHIPPKFFFQGVWLGFAINLGVFYLTYFALVFFAGQPYLQKVGVILLLMVLAVCLSTWGDLNRLATTSELLKYQHHSCFLLVNSFVKTVFSFSAIFTYSIINLIKQRQHFNKIKLNTLQTELELLKSQTNPHFLFNTLNALYSKAYVSHQHELAEHIGQLSSLMQYTISQSNKSFVKLEDEIDHIEAYLGLQKLRLGEHANIRFEYAPISNHQQIPPMLLNPLVENACKYGLLNDPNSFVEIKLNIEAEKMVIAVSNSNLSVLVKQSSAYHASGSGLNNLLKRLTILFDDNFSYEVNNQPDTYTVRLTIPCN